jgi:hypothetical protein
LWTVFETGNSGVQRTDLETGITETVWQSRRPVRSQRQHVFHRRAQRRIDLQVTSKSAKRGTVNSATDYFDAGQTFVLRVGDGNTPNATGSFTWMPITDEEPASGRRLPSRSDC